MAGRSSARTSPTDEDEVRRALVLHDRRAMVDLIELTLNHGLFVVRAVASLARRRPFLADWHPHLARRRHGPRRQRRAASQARRIQDSWRRRVTPVLGLTRRGDLATKLRAFDLGVDDILTIPFSPEELLARAIVITRRASGD